MPLRPGTRLDCYEIISPLGSGGMGEVYRARDTRLGREVAVKVLPERASTSPDARQRFEREARAVAALSHPNILAIHDVGRSGDVSWAVMELLEGETLRQRLSSVRLSPRKAVAFAIQVAHALSAAHDRGIVHRDLKPENVFVTGEGRVKVLDFGLAKLTALPLADAHPTRAPTLSRPTAPGTVMGTVAYMSPEQVRGEEVDARSDIFAFGTLLYEMLTGQPAFARGTAAETMSAVLRDDPPEPGPDTGVPGPLARVVGRCLEKRASERFQSALDVGFVLELLADLGPGSDSGPGLAQVAVEDQANATPSIAVLPFTNMSADPEQEYFCEGMAEEILNALTRLEGLRVAARSSAFQFKERGRDLRKVGEVLGVKTVLEGSVRTSGKRLRVTAELVNVADGYGMWSERYDRQAEDVFDIQDDITERVVEALRGRLVGAAVSSAERDMPKSLEAYHLYLKGQHNWFRRERDSLLKAARFFEEAAEKDPTYVLAHVGVANAHTSLGFFGAPYATISDKAHAAMGRALSLDEGRAEVQAGLGLMRHWVDWDFARAEKAFRRALERQPSLVLAQCWYSFLLNNVGRHEESLACARAALERDPLSPYVQMSVGMSHVYAGRGDDAVAALEKARETDGAFLTTLWALGLAYGVTGRRDDAARVLEIAATVAGRSSFFLAALAWGWASAGRRREARDLIDELQARQREEYVAPGLLAWGLGALGDTDKAFACLEQSLEQRDSHVAVLLGAPFYDSLRSDSRLAAIRERVLPSA
jgi:serine/threonine-protein kinase